MEDKMATWGERNNNPGCIKGRTYPTLEEGYEALNSLLVRKYNNRTCYDIFQEYAPYSDGNNPREYADFVIKNLRERGLDVDDNTRLDLSNPEMLQELTIAISKMENSKVLGGEEMARRCSLAYHAKKFGGQNMDMSNMYLAKSSKTGMSSDTLAQQLAAQERLLAQQNAIAQAEQVKQQQLQQQKLQKEQESKEKVGLIGALVTAGVSMLTGNSGVSTVVGSVLTDLAENVVTDTSTATASTEATTANQADTALAANTTETATAQKETSVLATVGDMVKPDSNSVVGQVISVFGGNQGNA